MVWRWFWERLRMTGAASGPRLVVVVMSDPSGEVGGGGGTGVWDVVDVEMAYLWTR